MSKIWRRWLLGTLLCGALLELAPACGVTTGGGETGSETHWLVSCETTADCAVGQCLCGVCTEPCRVAQDCPAVLDVCAVPDETLGAACEVPTCRSSTPGEIKAALDADQRIDTCDDGRPSSLVMVKHRLGAERAFADGERGFLLSGYAASAQGATRVSAAGKFMRPQTSASDLNPELDQVAPLPDGGALLSGSVVDFDGPHGWIGKVDATWRLIWELELEQPAVLRESIVPLPDGGAVMVTFEQEGSPDSKAFHVTWTRISPQGAIGWQRRAAFDNGGVDATWSSQRALALTDSSELRIAIQTDVGVQMIFGTLEGESELRLPDVDLMDVSHLVALPNDRVALLGRSKVVVLDAAGELVWQRDYSEPQAGLPGGWASAMVFNAGRQELLLVGQTPESGSWMLAVDLNGRPVWELQRKAQPSDGQGDRFALFRGRGPQLLDVAAAPDGTVIAPGFSNERLVYFIVGAGSCN